MLDTDTVIYTIKNKPDHLRETFNRHSGLLCISAVTLGELVYGAEKSEQPLRNLADVEGLAARLIVVPFDNDAATHFGQVRAELAKQGTPIGAYDQMIAGHARALGLTLVTNNTREFMKVSGLRIENWVQDSECSTG